MNTSAWFPEEDFKGLSDNFFDDLIDHINFPLEDIETVDDEGDWDAAGFQDLVPPPLDVLTSFSSEFTCKGQRLRVKKKPEAILMSSLEAIIIISHLHYLQISSLLSYVTTHIRVTKGKQSGINRSPLDVKVSKLFQSSSPVSVLKNTNSSVLSQNQNRIQRLAFPVKGIRSKRKHPTTPRFGFLQSFVSEMSQQFVPDELGSESYFCCENSTKKKRKKSKSHPPAHSVSDSPEVFSSDGTIRKCTHCETTKTPQWRGGLKGPKTLCNACGVRFKSGRLVPEYRPASSPTFIPTRHSNSHRKIIEMRRKGEDQFDNGRIYAVASQA